jgi:threonine dehydratase
MLSIPTLEDIRAAAARIAPFAHRTPVLTSRSLDAMASARLFFKCENLQKVGAFKFRGACNAVMSLSDEEAKRGVATHSSGNHAAALALAARIRGIEAHIVMPTSAPPVKRAAVEGYGGRVVPCEPTMAARESTLRRVVAETGATFVHPYDDPRVIAGQGTAALELLEEVPDLDVVVTPVGGGGLLSGTAIAVTSTSSARVIGVEPEAADDARRSLEAGRIIPSEDPKTIADGLRTSLGEIPFAVARDRVAGIVTVSEDAIASAMRVVWERMKIVIEPSSAVPVAALLAGKVTGARVGVVLSGGNVDLARLPFHA